MDELLTYLTGNYNKKLFRFSLSTIVHKNFFVINYEYITYKNECSYNS